MAAIIIEAALNGGRPRVEHPAVPVTPQEVAADALRCRDAGASVVHIHAQDSAGAWSADPVWYRQAIGAIRAAAPDLLVSITSIRPDDQPVATTLELLDALASDRQTRPDLISINLGHIVAWLPSGERTWRAEHFPNDYSDIVAVLEACARYGITPELGLMDLGFLSNAVLLHAEGLIPEDAWFLIELDSEGWGSGRQTAPSTPEVYDVLAGALGRLFPRARWAAHGAGVATWQVVERAITHGAHVRVGFEDTLELPDGSTAPSNAAQVAGAAALVQHYGYVPASPSDARAIIGVQPV